MYSSFTLLKDSFSHITQLLTAEVSADCPTKAAKGSTQRIFMYKELTMAPFVITTSVFCCRKPEAIRKTTPEPLLAEQ